MTLTYLKLPLDQSEYSALLKTAGGELRNRIDQAHFILREGLARHGLMVEGLFTEQQIQVQKAVPAEVQSDGKPHAG